MKRFSFQLPLLSVLLSGLMMLNACKKEIIESGSKTNGPNKTVTARGLNGLLAGVTVFSAGNPSQLIVMDDATGTVQNGYPMQIVTTYNQALNDVKGICVVGDHYYITTGDGDPYFHTNDNNLWVLDITTGVASDVSASDVGTVSDIDYNLADGKIYGLADNSNTLVSIETVTNPFDTYTVVGAITGIAANHTAKGLTVIRDANGISLKVAATTASYASGGNCSLYDVPFAAGAATFVANLLPNTELQGGHCAIGYDLDISRFQVNRQAGPFAVVVPGLNISPWPLGTPANTAVWGGQDYNFEDLTSTNQ